MIKINLLPQRRPKSRSTSSDVSAQPLLIGVLSLAAVAVAVAILIDRPKRARLSDLIDSNRQLDGEIAAKNRQLAGYPELKKASEEADTRFQAIQILIRAKVVPAHVLNELGEVLTANRYPTMTEEMTRRTGNGPDSDPNRRFQADWDPSHVWLTGFNDLDGSFTLEGGALTESDITQLAKRLAASVYFLEVVPASASRVADNSTGANYYKFTITGKVVY